jgi:hypothetical protein
MPGVGVGVCVGVGVGVYIKTMWASSRASMYKDDVRRLKSQHV